MGHARHSLPLLLVVLTFGVAAIAAMGCGSSEEGGSGASGAAAGATTSTAPAGASARDCDEGPAGVASLRVSGVDCASGRGVAAAWSGKGSCRATLEASRVSCEVGDYRCLGANTERGIAVSCARPGRSISFVSRQG